MALLMLFALVAGAGTAVSPCVLPVLPAALSAGASGGSRRPLGLVAGLVTTHTITIVAFASVVDGVGLASGFTRWLAIVTLVVFGVTMAVTALRDRVEAALSPLARLGPKQTQADGFVSGFALGGALGFVYAPCAGPILAAVISVSASQGTSLELVLIALSYGVGTGAVLFGLALGGRRVLNRVRAAGRGPVLQRGMAAVMIATGIAMAADLDTRFQTALANDLPDAVVNPTKVIEDTAAVGDRLDDLRGPSRFDSDSEPKRSAADLASAAPATPGPPSDLPALGQAPEFTDNQRWFNTNGGRPLTLHELRGRVVLIDFWTYTCINCIRTFPALKKLDAAYRDDGLTIVGVHTPEFAFERDPDNVKDAIEQSKLSYPVAQDNNYGTWQAWGNQYWPAKYLIDAESQVRYTHFGEGAYEETEEAVRSLLLEAGGARIGVPKGAEGVAVTTRQATPETYLGSARAERFLGDPLRAGTHVYRERVAALPQSHFALAGRWKIDEESATAVVGARLKATVVGKEVYLVLSSGGGVPRAVQVRLDGRPIPAALAGPDVSGGTVTVRRQRLYRLVKLPRASEHELELRFAPGVSGFAFTFG